MRVRSDAVTICPPPPPPCYPRTRHMYLAADATFDATTKEQSVPAADGGVAAGDGAAHEIAARPPLPPLVTRYLRPAAAASVTSDGGAAAGGVVSHEITGGVVTPRRAPADASAAAACGHGADQPPSRGGRGGAVGRRAGAQPPAPRRPSGGPATGARAAPLAG